MGLGSGALCGGPDECAPGLGCVETFGVAWCLAFCDPEADNDPCADDESRFKGECSVRLPAQSDIGLCLPTCDLAAGTGCPERDDVACRLPFGVPYAVCTRPVPRTIKLVRLLIRHSSTQ